MRQAARIVLLSLLLAATVWGQGVSVGDPAPSFSLPDQEGAIQSLDAFAGQKVLLYFYMHDDNPGDGKMARDLRDDYAAYQAAGIAILGVSTNDFESHLAFAAKNDLPFKLLADGDKTVSKLYGAVSKYPLASRLSLLIDENGTILHIIKQVDITTHSRDVLQLFDDSSASR